MLALGQLGDADGDKVDKNVRKTLQRLTSDTNQETRNFAIIALAQVAGRAGQGAGDAYHGTKDVRKHLLHTLARGKKRQRPWAGLALGVMGHSLREAAAPLSKDTGHALERMLDECKNPADVGAYAIAIGLRQDKGRASALTEAMGDFSDPGATSAIAIACGLFGDTGAVEGLRAMVDESKNAPVTIAQAAIALALLDDKTISRRLGDMLEDANGLASQASITTAMGFIGDRNSVQPLLASMRNEKRTDQARAFAAMALGMVADKDDEPWQACLTEGINYHAPAASLSAGDGTGLLEMP